MGERRQDHHGVRIIAKNHSTCFIQTLKECFNKQSTSDVVLLVNSCPEDVATGKWIPIQGNQCVLAAMSSVFREILASVPSTEETVATIHMAGYTYSAVFGLVHFLYHGYCPLWVDVNELIQILLDFKLVEEGTVDEHNSQQEKERERKLLLEQFFSEDEDDNPMDCLEIGPFVETKLEYPLDDDCDSDGVTCPARGDRRSISPVPEKKEPRKRGRPRKVGNPQPVVNRSPSLRPRPTRKSQSGASSHLPTRPEHSQSVSPRKRGRPRKEATKQSTTAAAVSPAPPKEAPLITSSPTPVISQSSAVTPVLISRPVDMEAVVSSIGGRFIPIKRKTNMDDFSWQHAAGPLTLPVCPVENAAMKIALPSMTETPLNAEGGTAVISGIPNAPACGFLIILNNTQQPQDGGGTTESKPTSLEPSSSPAQTGGTSTTNIVIVPREIPPESSGPVTCYRCGTCNETFGSEWDCRRHLKKHKYKCKYCDKCYPILSRLRNHMRCHTKEKPFKCHVCHKSFGHQRTLHYHLTIHSSVRSHQCSICAKTFKRKYYMRLHMRMHTLEKPYACPHCAKRFTQGSNMRKHLKTHQRSQTPDDDAI